MAITEAADNQNIAEGTFLKRSTAHVPRWQVIIPYIKRSSGGGAYEVKKVVVIGGSAGAIQALCSILKGIRADTRAALLAVIHMPDAPSNLSNVLQRCSAMTVRDTTQPTPIQSGNVYVACPNRHLIVRSGCAVSVKGPRENRHRPSVDTLFRSAARAYRENVVAVVLSGAMDDGSAGALAVQSRGGKIIVQDPAEAFMSDMPGNVLRQIKVDHCLKAADIAEVIISLTNDSRVIELEETNERSCEATPENQTVAEQNEPAVFTCPECGGALVEVKDGNTTSWRCHVGHRYSRESFSEAHSEAVERAIWVALRMLKERLAIQEQLASVSANSADMQQRFRENASAAAKDIQLLEEVLARL